jgi:hypothetical protein
MKDRGRLIIWDLCLLTGILLILFLNVADKYILTIGFSTVLIMTNCLTNHIKFYKLTGKLY